MKGFLRALGFLTVVPVRREAAGDGDFTRAAPWFPCVGLLIGTTLALAHGALHAVFPPLLSSALVVAFWAALTGGLHLDGLCDSCDALFASVTRERRLEILRDPHSGAFGTTALCLFLILKVAAVDELQAPAWLPLLLAPTAARWLVLAVATRPSARPEGLGAVFGRGLGRRQLLQAAPVPIALLIVSFYSSGWRGPAALLLAVVATGCAALAAAWRLGGITGDILGLSIELAELSTLLPFTIESPTQ